MKMDKEMFAALRMETAGTLIIPAIVTILWQFCLLVEMNVILHPFLSILTFFLLNAYFLFHYCERGYSMRGILIRLLVSSLAICTGLLLCYLLHLCGHGLPGSSVIALTPFTFGLILIAQGCLRFIILTSVILLRYFGADI